MLKCRFERAVYTGQQHFEITLARNEKDVAVEVSNENSLSNEKAKNGTEQTLSSTRPKYEHCVLTAYGFLPAVAKGVNGVFCAKKETKDHQKEARKEEPSVGVSMSRGRSDFSDKQYKYAVLKAYGFFPSVRENKC